MTTAIDRIAEQAPHAPTATVTQATAVEQARAVAEVAAAVRVALEFPRDLARAEAEMHDACRRLALAERAFYSVPNRGTGPSVHLARELARIWGNVQYGVHELRRDDEAGMSEVQAFAWDVQTNTRSSRTFQVPHQRMARGERQPLIDLTDVYLNNQNVGARAVRECIFTVLPTWLAEDAQERCRATLRDGEGVPVAQRIDAMVARFAEVGVRVPQLEERLGKRRGQWGPGEVAAAAVVFRSIERGETTLADEFPSGGTVTVAEIASTAPAAEQVADPDADHVAAVAAQDAQEPTS